MIGDTAVVRHVGTRRRQHPAHHEEPLMRYVMVPVPSEFVLEVLRLVIFRAPADEDVSNLRDEASIRRYLEGADEVSRSLLGLVARATKEDRPLQFSDAADQLGQDGEVLRTVLRDANEHALAGERELVHISDEIAVRVHGNVGKNRYLSMRPEHARFIRNVTRGSQEAEPATPEA
jgi:hypothetical protein